MSNFSNNFLDKLQKYSEKFNSNKVLDNLQTYNEKFHSALDDFSNSYINYKLYPEYSEHKTNYLNYKNIIESLQSNVFISSNDVQNNIDLLNNLTKILKKELGNAKKKNAELLKYLKNVTNDSNGSLLLIEQAKSLYLQKYISNITLLIGIIILFFTIFTVFYKNNAVNIH